ncbi:MAG: glucose-1-phosphate adenylyltransferase, partial [Bacillus sp. (in: Bacteria)]|nr:glucose-1-phosphate adenylyltransferase [Bacillus sp. (in: firmicutes)]
CAKVHHSLLSEGCEIYGTIENSVLFRNVKVGKGARIKNSVILPDTIVEANVLIENAVIGCHSVIKKGAIIDSKSPKEHLMVVGNYETIQPVSEDCLWKNHKFALPS